MRTCLECWTHKPLACTYIQYDTLLRAEQELLDVYSTSKHFRISGSTHTCMCAASKERCTHASLVGNNCDSNMIDCMSGKPSRIRHCMTPPLELLLYSFCIRQQHGNKCLGTSYRAVRCTRLQQSLGIIEHHESKLYNMTVSHTCTVHAYKSPTRTDLFNDFGNVN